MKQLKTRAAAALLMGLSLTAWHPAPAFAKDDNNGWDKTHELVPINTIVVNSCNGAEFVNITAVASIKTSTRIFKGFLSVRQNVKISGQGVGQVSGAAYRLDEKDHLRVMDGLPLPFSISQTATQKLKGAGVPDQVIRFASQFEVDANGAIVTDFVDFTIVCR